MEFEEGDEGISLDHCLMVRESELLLRTYKKALKFFPKRSVASEQNDFAWRSGEFCRQLPVRIATTIVENNPRLKNYLSVEKTICSLRLATNHFARAPAEVNDQHLRNVGRQGESSGSVCRGFFLTHDSRGKPSVHSL